MSLKRKNKKTEEESEDEGSLELSDADSDGPEDTGQRTKVLDETITEKLYTTTYDDLTCMIKQLRNEIGELKMILAEKKQARGKGQKEEPEEGAVQVEPYFKKKAEYYAFVMSNKKEIHDSDKYRNNDKLVTEDDRKKAARKDFREGFSKLSKDDQTKWDEERKKALQDKMKANAVEKERIKKEKSGLEPPSTPIPDEEADTEEEIHSDKELKKKVTKEKVEKKKGKKAKK